MFIQTEATPNPSTLKFIPGKPVIEGDPKDFRSVEDAAVSPLAERLFAVRGVEGVFLSLNSHPRLPPARGKECLRAPSPRSGERVSCDAFSLLWGRSYAA